MGKKKLKKRIKSLEKRIANLNRTPKINPIGYQYSLKNDDDYNYYDGDGTITWVNI